MALNIENIIAEIKEASILELNDLDSLHFQSTVGRLDND